MTVPVDDTRARAPWNGRAVLHVDMDAFFASVEQLDHPEWRGKPVVVGGSPDKRGVIAAASYEARRYGVHSAMSAARAAQLLPADAIWTRGDFARYGEVSAQVFAILRAVTPDVQPASIDEAYLDVTPGEHGSDPLEVARAIMEAVASLGVTCSIGVATSKTVAKIASERDKPRGLTVIRPGHEAAFLAPLPIEDMPGIGPATARRLRGLGIATLGQLAGLDDETARQVLGFRGPGAVRRARGEDRHPVRVSEPVKSVSNERTFSSDIREPAEVREALARLAERVATRLRRKALAGRTVHLKIRFGDFTTKTTQETLSKPTSSTDELTDAASRLLGSLWNPGVGIRLLGVGVSAFGEAPEQLDLLTQGARDDCKRRAVERAVDELRERFGDDAVSFGARHVSQDPRDKYGPGE